MTHHLLPSLRQLWSFAAASVLATCLLSTAYAQTPPSSVGLGGQIGDPSGFTLKLYQSPGFAYEFLAAWDLNDFFFLNGHALYEHPITDSPLRYYLGPGALVGVRNTGSRQRPANEFVVGISGQFGVNFFVERFEVFLHLTPRLNVLPSTNGHIGGGIGLRYYL